MNLRFWLFRNSAFRTSFKSFKLYILFVQVVLYCWNQRTVWVSFGEVVNEFDKDTSLPRTSLNLGILVWTSLIQIDRFETGSFYLFERFNI